MAGARFRLAREFTFDAAHRLPGVPEGHKCGRLHGHTFRVELIFEGEVDEAAGWVMDFADITRAFAPCLEKLDHRYLNEVEGLENPTVENIARWVWVRVKRTLPLLLQVNVTEAETSRCEYQGPVDS